MTHGFFKGLLFLDSGSVIHAVHEEQDMRKMGGLSKKIPITYVTMFIGSLAISGIPPLAGFFSKDEILGESFKLGFWWVSIVGYIVAGLTAFYMFRLMGLTFWGSFRGPKAVWDKVHESVPVMTIPLILLAIPSIFLGMFLGLPLGDSRLHHWVEPVFEHGQAILYGEGHAEAEYALFGIDGVAHPRQRDDRRRRHRPGLAPVRRQPAGVPPRPEAGAGPGPHRAGAVPVPRVAQQVVVRRAQPLPVHGHRRQGRERHVVVRPRGRRRHGQLARAERRSRPAAGSAWSRPAGSRTTPWASPSA